MRAGLAAATTLTLAGASFMPAATAGADTVPVTGTPSTVSADPLPTWLAVPGLLVVAALILVYACIRVRRVEISYSTD